MTAAELAQHYEPAQRNCPNCGAPIRATVCEYCGTNFRSGNAIDIIVTREQTPEESKRITEEIRNLLSRAPLMVAPKDEPRESVTYTTWDGKEWRL